MNTFIRFFYEFMSVFFGGIFAGLKGLGLGIVQMFDFKEYAKIIDGYKEAFNGSEKIFVILSVAILAIFIILIGILIFLFIKKMFRTATSKMNKQQLMASITFSMKYPWSLNTV